MCAVAWSYFFFFFLPWCCRMLKWHMARLCADSIAVYCAPVMLPLRGGTEQTGRCFAEQRV